MPGSVRTTPLQGLAGARKYRSPGEVAMSFIVAGSVLLLALLAGIVLDGIGRRERAKSDHATRDL